jgi:hypothetical protein
VLSLALVVIVDGNRLAMSPAEVRAQLENVYHIDPSAFTVCRFAPEDFLVRFRARADLEDVINAPTRLGTLYIFLWRRWRRHSMASARSFRFKVLLAMTGVPSHVWSLNAAQRILGSSCAGLELPHITAGQEDMSEFLVSAWCIHPDLIAQEVVIAVPEPAPIRR